MGKKLGSIGEGELAATFVPLTCMMLGMTIGEALGAGSEVWPVLAAAATGAVGVLIVTLSQRHPTRRRFWIPVSDGLLLAACIVAATSPSLVWRAALFGAALATQYVAVAGRVYAPERHGLLVLLLVLTFLTPAGVLLGAGSTSPAMLPSLFIGCAIVTSAGLAISLVLHRRPIGETLGEWPIRVLYRLRAVGPGMQKMSRTGPVLVISNHPSYLDPCWLMICLPRDLTPLMFAEYYQIPGLHFYMKHVVGAIPSGATKFRREAPELDEIVRRLDRGEGVLVFPEGWVRRSEEEDLRRFAQGAWRVLRDRPTTPVVACWIEGGWGSWASFKNGRPFKGWPDFRRPIDMAVSAPVVLDAETLADQHRTRERLREMVLDARRHLGLPPKE